MAGAVDVPGNLDPQTIPKQIANPKAEWNVFWDPMAVDWIFANTHLEIVLLPLDVTNKARVSDRFQSKLKKQQSQYVSSRIAFQGYEPTLDEPYFRLWNSAAACFIGGPEYFAQPQTVRLSVKTQGYMQGALQRDASGREVKVVFEFDDLSGFYDYFVSLLQY
jgi:inosine-uridine nucleoside N-ribohydrolase